MRMQSGQRRVGFLWPLDEVPDCERRAMDAGNPEPLLARICLFCNMAGCRAL